LSRESIHQALVKLGFTETEAKVYVQLTTEGPQSSRDIAKALNLHTRQICTSLKNMQSRGFVEAIHKCRNPFLAVPFEKILDLLIKANIEQAKSLMQNKKELLSTWRSITEEDDEKS
jgi:sugar-specific transcriptional regulator TrmB